MKISLFAAAFVAATMSVCGTWCAPALAGVIRPKVVIVAYFEIGNDTGDRPGELQYWVERDHLTRIIDVPGMTHHVRANADGSEIALAEYAGKVLLIVNTASRCGFTPQYAGLEALQKEYAPRGFSVLGFPCNQFGGQEPGTAAEIGSFCETTYKVSFPLFAKIDVNGDQAHPLYAFLKQEKKGFLGTGAIKWNFTKFLVDRQGHVAERAAPQRKPEDLRPDIEKLLAHAA